MIFYKNQIGSGLQLELLLSLVLCMSLFSVVFAETYEAECIDPCLDRYGHVDCSNPECADYFQCRQACPASKLNNSVCYFNKTGNCTYSGSQICPPAGTNLNGTCYYGNVSSNATCTTGGCALSIASMSVYNFCDPITGPQDTIGPSVLNLSVAPSHNNGSFTIFAALSDSASSIKGAEYFLRKESDSQNCGAFGNGTPILPADDSAFNQDKLYETISASCTVANETGAHKVCLLAQDKLGNNGNCTCTNFYVDKTSPETPGNVSVSIGNVSGSSDILACNTNPTLKFTVCDTGSDLQAAEYFLDMLTGTGYPLSPLNHYLASGKHCSDFSGNVGLASLADGEHKITQIRGGDVAGNWGNISGQNFSYSFIKDSTAPATTKTLISNETFSPCGVTNINGKALTDGCFFIGNNTTIVINASDQVSGDVRIYYRIWTRAQETDNWSAPAEGSSAIGGNATIATNSTQTLLEFWAQDACGFNETPHYELDVVGNHVCGDKVCSAEESNSWCSEDCPAAPTKHTTSGSVSSASSAHIHEPELHWIPVNTTPIVQNITENFICTPAWSCGEWSICDGGIQIRTCTDLNNCTTQEGMPSQVSECTPEITSICGDGICDIGEDCPEDCIEPDESNAEDDSLTGRFLTSGSAIWLASALLSVLFMALAYLKYRKISPKGAQKAK